MNLDRWSGIRQRKARNKNITDKKQQQHIRAYRYKCVKRFGVNRIQQEVHVSVWSGWTMVIKEAGGTMRPENGGLICQDRELETSQCMM